MLEYLALGLLCNETLTGYEIKRKIKFCFGSFCKASFGSLYPAMKRLCSSGKVTCSESLEGRRKKVYYTISDKGRECFVKWLTDPPEVLDGKEEMLAHIFFFDMLEKDERIPLIRQYKEKNELYLEELLTLSKQVPQCNSIYYRLSTLCYGIMITRRTIEWCSHIIEGKPLTDLIKEEML